ncbi:hypothetical protein CDV36_001761 [Fusarium kuroshium]|uniref:Uncharacterized protein n=2 Tax=Fusarium solani species complex TaxID=232080 RepID=A0A3M2SM42_9HYPO|nr:hypothetical protein CDV36_001761 [Fusarium kuroshium]RSL83566.1 hypothetical protein CEP51_004439 [Fusarium floridanum]
MGEHIIILYNDSIDSDNWAAQRAVIRATKPRNSNTRIIWIFEPRQVSLGLNKSADQQRRCLSLITKHFPDHGKPFKVLLGGLLTEPDVEGVPGLSEEDKETLRLAIKPPYGPKEDAFLHRELVAWDHAAALNAWLDAPVEVFVDLDGFEQVHNPVNLFFHRQEELVARSEQELLRYDNIMEEPLPQRLDSLREWYRTCTKTAEEEIGGSGNSVKQLELDSLCETINSAESVLFLGGASLGILQRFIEKGVADKVNCHLQIGTCDLALNLFPNQFNIALNPTAAEFVFKHFSDFADFVVVPSHSAQNAQYSLVGLKKEGGPTMERRCLGFNCGEEPLKMARAQVSLDKNYPDRKAPMSDLTAFLYALKPGFGNAKKGFVQVENRKGTLLFRTSESGIKMYDLKEPIKFEADEVVALLDSLEKEKKTQDNNTGWE